MKLGSVILFAKDMRGAVTAFYKDVVGLHPDEKQPFPPSRLVSLQHWAVNCASIAQLNRTEDGRKSSSTSTA